MTPELTRDWSARAGRALVLAGELEPPFVVHLGDLTQEFPESPAFEEGRAAARRQLEASGLSLRFVPGNMDIGDKPDPTILANWVEPAVLAHWERAFGKSFSSFTHGDLHFVLLNSQIMNSELREATEQRRWLEADLEANAGLRVFVFLHVPPFLVDASEPWLGSYDVLGEPDRAWLLGLLRSYDVEALFSAHTHFRMLNRVARTRLYGLPSTTTTRAGFSEAFSVLPAEQGKADVAKLGFALVRVHEDATRVHLVRTEGETTEQDRGQRLVTCTPRDLPYSPVGVYLRHPLCHKSDGVVAYPNYVRHRIRDDYPLLACLELGAHHVRFPGADLDEPLQRDRLAVLRDEGVRLTAMELWPMRGDGSALRARVGEVDAVELQLVGRTLLDDDDLATLEALRSTGTTLAVAPLLLEDVGKVHRRGRVGFTRKELVAFDAKLAELRGRIDRAVCLVDASAVSPWDEVLALGAVELGAVAALDFVLQLSGGNSSVVEIAEGLLAAATIPDCRLYIDPLQDLDRTADVVRAGLLDRLSNPRPAFNVTRTLNTVLFGGDVWVPYKPLEPLESIDRGGDGRVLGAASETREIWLVLEGLAPEAELVVLERRLAERTALVIDPVAGTLRELDPSDGELERIISLTLAAR